MKMKPLVLFLGLSVAASGWPINATGAVLGSLDVTSGSSPWGEVVDDPSWSFNGERRFGFFFAQTFTAPTGQADSIALRLYSSFPSHPDGVDFRVLISDVVENRPYRVLYESPVYTLGMAAGISGTSIDPASPITINLPQIDLIDGGRYAFVIDTVSTADGLNGAGSFQGNSAFSDGTILQLTVTPDGRPIVPWEVWGDDVSGNDFSFSLHFAEGGVANPTHTYIWDFAERYESGSVPEPGTLGLIALGLAGFVYSRRKQ